MSDFPKPRDILEIADKFGATQCEDFKSVLLREVKNALTQYAVSFQMGDGVHVTIPSSPLGVSKTTAIVKEVVRFLMSEGYEARYSVTGAGSPLVLHIYMRV